MFIPTTLKEVHALGWTDLDVILVTGDAYIDSPFMGVAVIGKVLISCGFRVGIIAQPDTDSDRDIARLGEPRVFWGITGGAVDSMVANYTAAGKFRKQDDYTPGGGNTRRPDRAVIVYANLVRRFFKSTVPLVLGGIEASLRRIAHYDVWSNKIRRSILFDARADYLVFGMGHASTPALAAALKAGTDPCGIPGIGYIAKEKKGLELPPFEQVQTDKTAYAQSFITFYENMDPVTGQGLCQRYNDRYLILNAPFPLSTTRELDQVHDLDFERDVHPFHKADGKVRALDTIRFSITTHTGCYGECNFCAIAVHQGRTVTSRSPESILKEARALTRLPDFKGIIQDLGGPTANMYGFECPKKLAKGACRDKRCLYPSVCPSLKPDHSGQLELLKQISRLDRVKKVFVNSGIRHDLILNDKSHGRTYLEAVCKDHVSGQMKLAPEHTKAPVLDLMGKPGTAPLLEFKAIFDRLSARAGKKQFLTYYFIAAHPGCTGRDMEDARRFCLEHLKISPEQVQIFTATPSTFSTLMYYTGINPFDGKSIFVEKDVKQKQRQKAILTEKRGKTGDRRRETGNRKQETGNQRPETGGRKRKARRRS